ncbi:MAG: transposase, partial [Anaerovoracaceae bacterium]
MTNNTSKTYQLKREIVDFSKKVSKNLSKPGRKFAADMIYGMLASNSSLLTNIADSLHEESKKANIVDRLSKHLSKGISTQELRNYDEIIKTMVPPSPTIFLDDTDITKPYGEKFEALGRVRDGSKSSNSKNIYEKGYRVTEGCVLTSSKQPISFFSEIYSEREKEFRSQNITTYAAMEKGTELFDKATFVMDRGYDANGFFLKMAALLQDYVIRLTLKRKLYFHNKWFTALELLNRRKGKIKMAVNYRGEKHSAYLSHVKVQITASKKNISLILVYGLAKTPMILATNKTISCKEDVMAIAKLYFSRWRIEEYFRSKKQIFKWEGFRVRKLVSMNALNFYLGCAMAFLNQMSMKSENSNLKSNILKAANSIERKVYFFYYRIANGIESILSYARAGPRPWFK